MSTNSAPGTLTNEDELAQSLARGQVGTALLHLARAHHGIGTWQHADAHIRRATTGPIDAGHHAGLYYGAPAVAFLLNTAADLNPRYQHAAHQLDPVVTDLTRARLAQADARHRSGARTAFAEYDLFYGLTGITALLLRHHATGPVADEHTELVHALLNYTVSLTRPCTVEGVELPGWWVDHDPDRTIATPGGHANLGMAHGAAGLLALLALATLAGHQVPDQPAAIATLTDFFDRWAQPDPYDPGGIWWPHWITRDEHAAGHPATSGPGRSSWCYGTPGIARALQLAALTTADPRRQHAAEHALAASLTDTRLDQLTDHGLCHGIAGTYQTAHRAAADALTPTITQRLSALAERLNRHANTPPGQPDGLLTGRTGTSLGALTTTQVEPIGWDRCLLIC